MGSTLAELGVLSRPHAILLQGLAIYVGPLTWGAPPIPFALVKTYPKASLRVTFPLSQLPDFFLSVLVLKVLGELSLLAPLPTIWVLS